MMIKILKYIMLIYVLHWNIDQPLVNSLQGMLKIEIGGLDCRFTAIEYIPSVH